jgi:hypothetical protein
LAAVGCSDSEPDDDGPPADAGEGGAERGGSGGSAGRTGGGRAGTTSAGKGGSSAGSAGDSQGGVPTSGGQGGQAGAVACSDCASGFCLDDGTCVECLPSDDQCPDGQYCTELNECAPGCKEDGGGCASGVCNEDHSCRQCISDDECTGEDVCGNGQCAPACTAEQEGQSAGCETGLTCCSLHCTEIQTDSNHCGACGAACGQGQFCGLDSCDSEGEGGAGGGGAGGSAGAGGNSTACVSCYDTTLANLCAIAKVIVILDTTKNPTEGNRAPGRAIGAALKEKCVPAPTVTEEEQDSVHALNFTTGRPVSGGGELLVVAGGPFFQNLEAYVEQEISPLYLVVDMAADVQQFKSRANDSVVASRTISGDNVSHDFFAIQFMRDPQSGSLVLNAQGFWLSGTTAASYFMLNGILPNIASYDEAWYVYEWTDANGDMAPSLDEIVLRASGT